MGCVYLVTNQVNGKQYVGKTIYTLKHRREEHLKDARNPKPIRRIIHCAVAKYGPSNFKWKVLYRSNDEQRLMNKEVRFIAELGTKVPNGYNLTDGGEGVAGLKRSEESRERNRQVALKQWESEEEREKKIQGQRKRYESEEEREKTRQANLNYWASPVGLKRRGQMSKQMKGHGKL